MVSINEVYLMGGLALIGLGGTTAILWNYPQRLFKPWMSVAFACVCGAGAIYGSFQHAWLFAITEWMWALVAPTGWRDRVKS